MITDPVTVGPDATLAELDAPVRQVPRLRPAGRRRRAGACSASSPTATCGSSPPRRLRDAPRARGHDADAAGHRARSASRATTPPRCWPSTRSRSCRWSTTRASCAGSSPSRTSSSPSSTPTRPRTARAGWSSAPPIGFFGDAWERATALVEAGRRRARRRHRQRARAPHARHGPPAQVRPGDPRTSRSSAATSPPARARRRSSTRASTRSRSASGPGSICTTRVVAGVGVPQVTAIYEAARACKPAGVPVIGDGGLQYSGDIAKALVAGADTVMLGVAAGRLRRVARATSCSSTASSSSTTAGMGSLGAMASRGPASRTPRTATSRPTCPPTTKIIPEGIEGQVPYRGPLSAVAHQLVGGLHQSMFYVGAHTIPQLQDRGQVRPDHRRPGSRSPTRTTSR